MPLTDQEAHDQLLGHLKNWEQNGDIPMPKPDGGYRGLTDAEIDTVGDDVPLGRDTSGVPGGVRSAAPPPAGPSSSPRGMMAQAAMGAKPAASARARPPIDTSKPLGSTQDTELRDLQSKAADERKGSELGQAVTAFTERPTNFLEYAMRVGGGGTSAPPRHNPLWDGSKDGDRAVSDLMARRQSEAGMAAQKAAQQRAAEAKDPNSDTAKTYRATLLKFAPDLSDQLASATPEQMEKIAPWLEKYASENSGLLKSRSAAEQRAAEDAAKQGHEGAALDETTRHNKATEGNAGAKLAARAHAGARTAEGDDFESNADAIATYDRKPPTAKQDPDGHIMAAVRKRRPDYSEPAYYARQAALSHQATDPHLNAAKASREHLNELKAAVADEGGGMIDSPMINGIARRVATGAGSSKYTRKVTAAKIVGAEIAGALGENDKEGKEMVQRLVDPDQSQEQWAASIPTLEKLRDEKLGIYERSAAKPGSTARPGKGSAVQMHKKGFAPQNVPADEVADAMKEGWAE